MLKQRLISAFVLSIGLVSLIFALPNDYLIYFILFLTCFSLFEFLGLRFSTTSTIIWICFSLVLFYLSSFASLNQTFIGLSVLLHIGLFFLILSFPVSKPLLQRNVVWLIAGVIIHLGFFASLYFLVTQEELLLKYFGIDFANRLTLLIIVLISVLMDTIAYFGGKKFGRIKLLQSVSPNKTVEGFLIAITLTPIIILLLTSSFVEKNFSQFFILILVSSFVSVIGDAAISLFKRVAEVKDTSNLIPGHGGLLDRIDSHLATIPAFIFTLLLFS
tara:strand:- start:5311 stop:6132 length:822 start_codon:yes stop_codon:yes gene_type:complete